MATWTNWQSGYRAKTHHRQQLYGSAHHGQRNTRTASAPYRTTLLILFPTVPRADMDAKVAESIQLGATIGKILNELERLEIVNHAMPVEDQVGIAISYALKWKGLSEARSDAIAALQSQLAEAKLHAATAIEQIIELTDEVARARAKLIRN